MPIERIPYPEALPINTQDYVKQNNLIETGFLRVNDPWPIVGGNIVKGAVFQCGGTVYLADANTAIGGVASNYVKFTPSGDGSTLAPTYVANLAGVSWNNTYNGYYDVGGNLYVFDEMTALIAGEVAVVKTKTGNALNTLLGLNATITGDYTMTGDNIINASELNSYKTNEGGADVLLKSVTDGNVMFYIKKPISAWFYSTSAAGEIFIYQNGDWRVVYEGAGPRYNLQLNPGYYFMGNVIAGQTAYLYCSGVYGLSSIIAGDIVT